MLTTCIAAVLSRDLRALRREIEAYGVERDLWRVEPGIGFSAGTVLGATGYVRDRAAEFARRDVPRTEVLRELDAALAAVERGVARLPDTALSQPYPQPPGGFAVTTGDFLLHLISHLTYHLGQVDYHRRLLTGEAGQIRAVALGELATASSV